MHDYTQFSFLDSSCGPLLRYFAFPTHLTLKMTSTQVVETSVNVTSNSPSQGYIHPVDHNNYSYNSYDLTPGFKSFFISLS